MATKSKISAKQLAFVDAYIGEAQGNATEAARLAGYLQPNVQGPRLLVNVSVQSEIKMRVEARAMSADEILQRLTAIGRADICEFFKLDKKGNPLLDLKTAKANGLTWLIKEIAPTRYGYKLKLHDAQTALQLLGKFHGLFNDLRNLSDEQLRQLANLACKPRA